MVPLVLVAREPDLGTAIVVVRLLRAGNATGPLPLATLTGGGTLAGAGGATDSFTISGP